MINQILEMIMTYALVFSVIYLIECVGHAVIVFIKQEGKIFDERHKENYQILALSYIITMLLI